MRRIVLATALGLVAASAGAQEVERVTLDAPEKRIVRESYHDARAVTLGGREGGGWSVYAGAAIDARRIDLTLRNVRGEVTYRADASKLEAILRRRK